MTRYEKICKLIEDEVNEIVEDDELYQKADSEREREILRDELIGNYLNLLKDELQSDNA
jgi:hypothetical protein